MTNSGKRIDGELVFLLSCTLLTLLAWVSFEVYRAYTKPKLPEGIEKYLIELNPNLNEKVLDDLEKRSL